MFRKISAACVSSFSRSSRIACIAISSSCEISLTIENCLNLSDQGTWICGLLSRTLTLFFQRVSLLGLRVSFPLP